MGGSERSRRAFRAVFRVCGAIALAAGIDGVARGGRAIPGVGGPLDPVVESELRFFSAFYAGYGALLLSAAGRADRDASLTRGAAGALWLAGLSRLVAWRQTGPPNSQQRALLAIELAGPPAIVAWQRRL